MDINWFKRLTGRVLELTDELDIHREAVTISLDREAEGSAVVADRKLAVVGPEHDDIEAFIASLRETLAGTDLSSLPKAEEM